MSEHTITINELKKVITENKIRPSMVFDEKRLCADPEVLKLKAAADAKLIKEIEAEEDNADHIPDDGLQGDGPSDAGNGNDDEADHIPD